ncbi:MAG: hypothetical protein IT371_12550 [Deltaproteobacteria bacterium]|nr:hypothetical protein [Deltaproteobacteria bacterium]
MRKPVPASFPAATQAHRPAWLGASGAKVVRLAFVSGDQQVDLGGAGAGHPSQRGLTDEELLAVELAELRDQAEAEGRAVGEELGRQAYAEATGRLEELLQQLGEARTGILHAMEGQLVDLALAVAGAVIEREVREEPEYVVRLVREVLGLIGEADRVEVAVATQDYALLSERLAALTAEQPHLKGIVLRADPTIGAGCVVQTSRSLVDASVASRLAAVAKALKPMGIE